MIWGGYHLVWSRDMVETAGAMLAVGAHEDASRVLSYLQATQQPDGHWSQNMWLDGSPYWNGIQMDETALPILLVDLARRENALTEAEFARFWPMVRQAAGYLVRNGPASPQDRWEEDPGYSPFTVAAQIAALLAAADLADLSTLYAQVHDGNLSAVVAHPWLHQYGIPPGLRAIPLVEPEQTHSVGLVLLDQDPEPLLARALRDSASASDIASAIDAAAEAP